MSVLEDCIADLGTVCAGLPDRRQAPLPVGAYTMADIGLAAFSLFFMGSPSFLAHQRILAEGQGRSHCQTLFGIAAIPSDNYIRQILDGAPTAAFDGLFIKAIEAPGHQHVLPLPAEFIVPQAGAAKQHCERTAAKRWLARHGASLAHLRPVFLGDDLFACQPIAAAIQAAGGHFILTCKPTSHRTISDYLYGATLAEHRETLLERGKRTTTVYRWLADVPLRDSTDALPVTWFSIEMFDAKGKRTYHNSFVTDLPVSAPAPSRTSPLAGGRAGR